MPTVARQRLAWSGAWTGGLGRIPHRPGRDFAVVHDRFGPSFDGLAESHLSQKVEDHQRGPGHGLAACLPITRVDVKAGDLGLSPAADLLFPTVDTSVRGRRQLRHHRIVGEEGHRLLQVARVPGRVECLDHRHRISCCGHGYSLLMCTCTDTLADSLKPQAVRPIGASKGQKSWWSGSL